MTATNANTLLPPSCDVLLLSVVHASFFSHHAYRGSESINVPCTAEKVKCSGTSKLRARYVLCQSFVMFGNSFMRNADGGVAPCTSMCACVRLKNYVYAMFAWCSSRNNQWYHLIINLDDNEKMVAWYFGMPSLSIMVLSFFYGTMNPLLQAPLSSSGYMKPVYLHT